MKKTKSEISEADLNSVREQHIEALMRCIQLADLGNRIGAAARRVLADLPELPKNATVLEIDGRTRNLVIRSERFSRVLLLEMAKAESISDETRVRE